MAKAAKSAREDRLKAALKANMGRRKAQARARADEGSDATEKAPAPEQKDKNNG
ncbi:MAG: hypothetical protein AAFY65_16700 [Pseudomonadota bacterium]